MPKENFRVKRYAIQYPISAYTFPSEARIEQVRFDRDYIHLRLTDERVLSILLHWIPTLSNAVPDEREKYRLNHSRTMLIWDPSECAINDELRLADYLSAGSNNSETLGSTEDQDSCEV